MKTSPELHSTLPYLVLAAAGIGCSSRAVEILVQDPRLLVLAITTKGWMFVLGTGLILFWMMGRGRWQTVTVDQRPLRPSDCTR